MCPTGGKHVMSSSHEKLSSLSKTSSLKSLARFLPKRLGTLNEQEIAKSTAGWKWIQDYLGSYMAKLGVKVQDLFFFLGWGFE